MPKLPEGYLKNNRIIQGRQGQLTRFKAGTHLLQISMKNAIQLQVRRRAFLVMAVQPTDEAIVILAIQSGCSASRRGGIASSTVRVLKSSCLFGPPEPVKPMAENSSNLLRRWSLTPAIVRRPYKYPRLYGVVNSTAHYNDPET